MLLKKLISLSFSICNVGVNVPRLQYQVSFTRSPYSRLSKNKQTESVNCLDVIDVIDIFLFCTQNDISRIFFIQTTLCSLKDVSKTIENC